MRIPLAAWSAFLPALLREKAPDGPWLRLPGHSVRLSAADERLWGRIRPLMAAGRFQPPRVRDYAQAVGVPEETARQLLRQLAKMGELVQVAHDHFFFRSTVAELAAIAERIAERDPGGELTAAGFRNAIDTGRKVAIPILQFFDRAGVTTRRGDRRTVDRQKAQRFDPVEARAKLARKRASPVGRLDFKSGKGRQAALDGFDSHSLPPPAALTPTLSLGRGGDPQSARVRDK